MSVNLTVNELAYQYPETGDEDWGPAATAWAEAVTNLLSFMRSSNAPFATVGQLRFGNGDKLAWRNFANNGNIQVYVDNMDRLLYDDGVNPVKDLSLVGGGNLQNPGASVDETIPRFDGATNLIQLSGVTISDTDDMAGLNSLDTAALTIGGASLATFLTNDFIDVILSSTDNALARWDGATGKQIQNSLVTLDDLGAMAGLTSLSTAAITLAGSPITDLFIDVIGSSTDNALTRWDGTNGKQVQNSGVTVSDTNDMTVPGNMTIQGAGVHSVSEQFANEVFEEYARPTGAAPGVRGVAHSGGLSGTRTSTTFADVAGSDIDLVTTGRPVIIELVAATSGASYVAVEDDTTGGGVDNEADGEFEIQRDGSTIATFQLQTFASSDSTALGIRMQIPPGLIKALDVVAAGTYEYKLRFRALSAANQIEIANCRLIAYEL